MACYQNGIRKHVIERLTEYGMDLQLVDGWADMVVSELNTSPLETTYTVATATAYVRAAERIQTTVLQNRPNAKNHAASVLTHNGMPPKLALALFTEVEQGTFDQQLTDPTSLWSQLAQTERYRKYDAPATQMRADAHTVIRKCQQFANAERVAAWAEASAVLITSVAHGPGFTGTPLDVRLQQDLKTAMIALQHAYPDARPAPRGLASLITIPPDVRNGLAPMVRELAEYGLPRIQLSDASIMGIVGDLMKNREAGPPDGWNTAKPLKQWKDGIETDQDGHVITLRLNNMGPIASSILHWVSHLPHLKTLHVKHIGSAIPSSIAQLTALTELEITGATSIPPEIGEMANLEWLRIEGSTIGEGVLPALGQLPTLKTLSVNNCTVVGGLSPYLGHLTRLEQMEISNTAFEDRTLPDIFAEMSALRYLDLTGCQFTGTFPASLIGLERLITVCLVRNQLHGSIPDTIRTREEIMRIDLRNSGITDLPPDLPKHISVTI